MTIRSCGHISQSWDSGVCYVCQRNARDRARRPEATAPIRHPPRSPADASQTAEAFDDPTPPEVTPANPTAGDPAMPARPATSLRGLVARYLGSYVGLYSSLTAPFKGNYSHITLVADVERELAVTRLVASSTYRETHAAISEISTYAEFAPEQVVALVEAANRNGQVTRILGDADVRSFYKELAEGYGDSVDQANWPQLLENIGGRGPDEESAEAEARDILGS